MTSQGNRVTAVLVTYNSASVIGDALASLPQGTEVRVVDNASGDDTATLVHAHGATLIQSPTNLGFGNACNLGAENATREFLLFLNPDAVMDPGALEALVARADAHSKAAAFNPRIMRPDGSQFFRVRSQLFPETKTRRKIVPDGDQAIQVLSGAAVLIRRAVFDDLGGFDPNIFMYAEDDDLGLRLLNAGWELRYVHDAVVVHQGNQSSAPSRDLDVAKSYHEMRSRWYTTLKHAIPFSRPGQGLQSAVNYLAACVTFNAKARRKHWGRLKALIESPPEL